MMISTMSMRKRIGMMKNQTNDGLISDNIRMLGYDLMKSYTNIFVSRLNVMAGIVKDNTVRSIVTNIVGIFRFTWLGTGICFAV